jgi:hypothetical protein
MSAYFAIFSIKQFFHMKRYSRLLLLIPFFFSCDNLVKDKDNASSVVKKEKPLSDKEEASDLTERLKRNEEVKDPLKTNSDADILNKIIVHEAGGLKVSRAFLAFEDGTLVPKSNKTVLRKPVYLTLVMEGGWKVKNGKVSLDASEKITTHEGEIVLNATSLFQNMPLIEAEKANYIYLKANITGTRPDIAYFIVNYRVWDKRGTGEVKGSYKLYLEGSTYY